MTGVSRGGATQATKDRVITGLVRARRALLDAVDTLPPAERDTAFIGVWSAKELLAHLVGWDHTNQEAVGEILAGRRPSFSRYRDHDWQTYNALLVERYRRDDWNELLELLDDSHRQLIAYLESVANEEYIRRRSIGRLLRFEARDEGVHRQQVEAFRER
jgi:hypothetical protein